MDTPSFTDIVKHLRSTASVTSVYGEPVEHADKTVIPVARVAYGFGGGYGSGDDESETDGADTAADAEAGGEGAGFGGGVTAMPIGVVEITEEETRFIRFNDRKRAVRGILLGVVIGLLLGLARRKRD